jgi:hypothetical protein
MDVIKEVAWEVIKDLSGWNDIVDCFTKGDVMARLRELWPTPGTMVDAGR